MLALLAIGLGALVGAAGVGGREGSRRRSRRTLPRASRPKRDRDEAEVACSEGLLRQALTNLVENAVKYRRPEVPPEVEISGSKRDGEYQLRVSDDGAGISAEETARIFEPLYRSPRVQHLPGTGLGLSIVNRIVQASGGAISVESRLEEGSTFVVHLKLANHPTG
jgi:signal transduction histidine kinase